MAPFATAFLFIGLRRRSGRVSGDKVSFTIDGRNYRGIINSDAIEGERGSRGRTLAGDPSGELVMREPMASSSDPLLNQV
ncbi:MAG: hypothetical protein GEU91_08105 [Rhizobiales bacterium]|nr:hypothetical protein [Hyphomicrobiales bacterium]